MEMVGHTHMRALPRSDIVKAKRIASSEPLIAAMCYFGVLGKRGGDGGAYPLQSTREE